MSAQTIAPPPFKCNIELHISERLRNAIPLLDDEERRGLEEAIIRDGEVTDAIKYWHDGEKAVIVDGMNRFEIATKHNIPYSVKPKEFADYKEAELWVKRHAVEQRNLTPEQKRRLIGEILNETKGSRGGDRKSEAAKSKWHCATLIGTEGGNSTDTASSIAAATGVNRSTVIRAGKVVEALDKFSEVIRKSIEKETDALILSVSRMTPEQQATLWGDVRTGRQPSWKAAAKERGYIRPKATKPKPEPVVASVEVTPPKPTVVEPSKPSAWDDIPLDLHPRLKELDTTSAEIKRLSELNMDQQREVVALVDGVKHPTVASALGAWHGPVDNDPKDKAGKPIPEHLERIVTDTWFGDTEKTLKKIITELKVRAQKSPYWKGELAETVEQLQQIASRIGDCQPATVCPECKGENSNDCGWCRKSGFMPAWAYNDWKSKQKGRRR